MLFVYLLIELQSVIHSLSLSLALLLYQCKNRREQLKQLPVMEYVIQTMSSKVTSLWRPSFHCSINYMVQGSCIYHPTTQGCITKY